MAWNIRTATTPVKPDLEILVQQANVDVAASIVLDASAVTPDAVTGERKLLAGQPLKKVGNQYVPWLTADGAALCLGILAHTVGSLTARQSPTLPPPCGTTVSGSAVTGSLTGPRCQPTSRPRSPPASSLRKEVKQHGSHRRHHGSGHTD
jgi:hypothetical protein